MHRPHRTLQHVNGDFSRFLRTRLFQVVAWTVITALLTLDAPWKLLHSALGKHERKVSLPSSSARKTLSEAPAPRKLSRARFRSPIRVSPPLSA